MSERVIGILGGMGPEATADLFLEIIRLTPARKDRDHVPVLIFSNPRIPDRTRAILGAGEDPLPALVGNGEGARTRRRRHCDCALQRGTSLRAHDSGEDWANAIREHD